MRTTSPWQPSSYGLTGFNTNLSNEVRHNLGKDCMPRSYKVGGEGRVGGGEGRVGGGKKNSKNG